MMATLKYRSFNPNGKKLYTYYATAPDNDACSGYGDFGSYGFSLGGLLAQMSVMPIDNSIEGSTTMRTKNFPIDMAMLSGEADLRNSLEKEVLPQGQDTVYGYTPVDFQPLIPQGDIDGDGIIDHAELNTETNQISIWLGGADPEENPPALVRQADFNPDFTEQGLVKEVSHDDLRNTDTFIYRVSNGQLFSARNGLLGGETDQVAIGDVSNTTDTTINYRQIIRGPRKTSTFQSDIEKWQASTNINEELRGWQADHIRTGEQLKVVMINRATGYIGSSIATYGENTEKGGILSFTPEKIHMLPPNLKIKVERNKVIDAGLTAGQEHIYTIGFEGSGLTSDKYIVITTDWFDHDGSPLPEDLPGYTGRLAKVVELNQLGQASGQIANFPIRPGHNLVVVQLPQEEIDTAHYYVHVNGEAMEGQPDFASKADFETTGAGEGLLQYRPRHYVPVRVPIYDEELTETAKVLRQQAIDKGTISADMPEVAPIYQWPFRPEMQFSLLDLDVEKVEEFVDEEAYDILQDSLPVISSTADHIDLFYLLLADELPMLEPFGHDRELIFSLGDYEVLYKPGGDPPLQFESLDHLNLLQTEDYLTISLFQNNDAANVLWELAFESLILSPGENREEIVVSADYPEVSINAFISGYALRKSENQGTYSLKWVLPTSSGGTVLPSLETKQSGHFSSTLLLPTTSGSTLQLGAKLSDSIASVDDAHLIKGPLFKIVAGEPASIVVTQSGTTAIGGIGEVNLIVTVRDIYGNLVEDGTAVEFLVDGDTEFTAATNTVAGIATATLKGLDTPGAKKVRVRAGKVTVEEVVEVADVSLTVTIPPSMEVDQTVPVTVTATSSIGNLDGLEIILRQSRGQLKSHHVVLTNDTATTQFYSGDFKGPGKILASFAGAYSEASFDVTPQAGMALSSQLVIGDMVAAGSVSVEREEADPLDVDYSISTDITVEGNPDDVVPVTIGDLVNPPIEPVLHYSMAKAYLNAQVRDSYGVIHGMTNAMSSVSESASGFGGSFLFNVDSDVRVDIHSGYDKDKDLGFSFEFKPSVAGATLVQNYLRSQKLSILPDNRLEFQIITDTGTFTVQSNPVELESWHRVAAHYKGDEILLEVDDQLFSQRAEGNLKRESGLIGMQIGGGYEGLMNQFRLFDWSAPVLLTLPNGETSMDVTIGQDGIVTVTATSTGQLGNRQFVEGYAGFAIPQAYFATPAFAGEGGSSGGWVGKVSAGTKKAALTLWRAHQYKEQLKNDFARGAIIGDTSTPAGIIGDIAVGSIPFGDGRDIAFQHYYQYFDPENPKYDKAILATSYIGLMADILTTTGIGEAINAGLASTKTTLKILKLVDPTAFKVLAEYLDDAAKAVKNKRDWTMVERMLPLMQIFTWVLIDDDAQQMLDVLCSGIDSSADLLGWLEYLAGWEEAEEEPEDSQVAFLRLKEYFVTPAYAKTSKSFQLILREILDKFADIESEKLGEAITAVVKEFNRARNQGTSAVVSYIYRRKTIIAATNLYRVGGKQALESFASCGSLIKTASDGTKYGRKLEDLLDDIVKLDEKTLDAMEVAGASGVRQRFTKVVKDLAGNDTVNKPKGAAHHIRCMAEDVDELADIEVYMRNVAGLGERFYDYIRKNGTRIEAKSWLPDNIQRLTKQYIAGSEEPQLLIDLVHFARNGFGPNVIKWKFDEGMSEAGKEIFKKTIKKTLKEGDVPDEVIDAMARTDIPGQPVILKTIKDYEDWIDTKLFVKLDDFIEIP
jgi:hypothetical protein